MVGTHLQVNLQANSPGQGHAGSFKVDEYGQIIDRKKLTDRIFVFAMDIA